MKNKPFYDALKTFDKSFGRDSTAGIIKLIKSNKINIRVDNLPYKCAAMATRDGIIFSDEVFADSYSHYCYYTTLFIILHEIGHYKRIHKSRTMDLTVILTKDNKEQFVNDMINEEIIANKYACYTLRKITGYDLGAYANCLNSENSLRSNIEQMVSIVISKKTSWIEYVESQIKSQIKNLK